MQKIINAYTPYTFTHTPAHTYTHLCTHLHTPCTHLCTHLHTPCAHLHTHLHRALLWSGKRGILAWEGCHGAQLPHKLMSVCVRLLHLPDNSGAFVWKLLLQLLATLPQEVCVLGVGVVEGVWSVCRCVCWGVEVVEGVWRVCRCVCTAEHTAFMVPTLFPLSR